MKPYNAKNSIKIILIFLLTGIFFTSCKTTHELTSAPVVTQKFNSHNAKIYVTTIDLETPDLMIIGFVDTENFFTIQEFCEKTNANYAFNTTPYFYNQNSQAQLLGYTKINGVELSPPIEKYSALAFGINQENKVFSKIIKNQDESLFAEYPMIIGGYFQILENGTIIDFKKTRRSRTACGITQDGRFLKFLTVISNKKSDLSGLTYEECGKILLAQGCADAMEFDGGHSTQFCTPQTGFVTVKKSRAIPAALGFYIQSN